MKERFVLVDLSATDSDPRQDFHDQIFLEVLDYFQNLARETININEKVIGEFALVCIDVHSSWRPLVDSLIPDYDWGDPEDVDGIRVAQASVEMGVCEYLAERAPGSANEILAEPSEGNVKLFILTEGSLSLFEIEPMRPRLLN